MKTTELSCPFTRLVAPTVGVAAMTIVLSFSVIAFLSRPPHHWRYENCADYIEVDGGGAAAFADMVRPR